MRITVDNFRGFTEVETSGILTGFLPVEVKNLVLEKIGDTDGYRVTSFPDDWKVYRSNNDTIVFDLNPNVVWTRFVDALGGISYQNGPGFVGTYTRLSDNTKFRGARFLNLSAS